MYKPPTDTSFWNTSMLVVCNTVVPNIFGSRDQFWNKIVFHGPEEWVVSHVQPRSHVCIDEASLSLVPKTGSVAVQNLGAGDPGITDNIIYS